MEALTHLDPVHRKLQHAFREVSQLATWTWDLSTGVLELDERVLSALGREVDGSKVHGDEFLSWLHSGDRSDFQKALKYHLEDGIPFDVRVRLAHSKGETIVFDLRGQAVRDDSGTAMIMIGVFIGPGVGTRSEVDFQAMLADHQRMLMQSARMSALGEMASGMAHEVNNPLAVIQARASLLKRQVEKGSISPEKFIEDLDRVLHNTDRIAKIVKALRAFSRNSESDPFEFVSVKAILEDTLELCRERFKNHEIDLRTVIERDAKILCRSSQVSEVLLNLLNNAHDAVAPLGERWVEVKVSDEMDRIILTLTDSGSGIPSDIADKMMQPFFTTKELGKGTGLGLPIARGIVEAHYGTIELDRSCPNTRFVVNLPKRHG